MHCSKVLVINTLESNKEEIFAEKLDLIGLDTTRYSNIRLYNSGPFLNPMNCQPYLFIYYTNFNDIQRNDDDISGNADALIVLSKSTKALKIDKFTDEPIRSLPRITIYEIDSKLDNEREFNFSKLNKHEFYQTLGKIMIEFERYYSNYTNIEYFLNSQTVKFDTNEDIQNDIINWIKSSKQTLRKIQIEVSNQYDLIIKKISKITNHILNQANYILYELKTIKRQIKDSNSINSNSFQYFTDNKMKFYDSALIKKYKDIYEEVCKIDYSYYIFLTKNESIKFFSYEKMAIYQYFPSSQESCFYKFELSFPHENYLFFSTEPDEFFIAPEKIRNQMDINIELNSIVIKETGDAENKTKSHKNPEYNTNLFSIVAKDKFSLLENREILSASVRFCSNIFFICYSDTEGKKTWLRAYNIEKMDYVECQTELDLKYSKFFFVAEYKTGYLLSTNSTKNGIFSINFYSFYKNLVYQIQMFSKSLVNESSIKNIITYKGYFIYVFFKNTVLKFKDFETCQNTEKINIKNYSQIPLKVRLTGKVKTQFIVKGCFVFFLSRTYSRYQIYRYAVHSDDLEIVSTFSL